MLTKMPSQQQQTTNHPSSSLQQLNSRSKKKLVNVSVTILSIDGLHVKDTTTPTTKTKKKGGFLGRGTSPSRRGFSPSRRKNNTKGVDNSNNVGGGEESCATSTASASVDPTTTIVASFSRVVKTRQGENKTVMTHVPSLPLSLSSSNDQDDDDGTPSKTKKKNKSKAVKTSSSVFHWPTAAAAVAQPSREVGQQQSGVSTPQQPAVDISHHQFKHPLIDYSSSTQEETRQQQAQQPSIQISISRAGRMFKLGTATIPIDTSSTSSSVITVLPIVNCNPAIPKKKSNISLSTATATVPMMKLKDTQIKCGLSPNATLRILLNVTHPIGETTQISDRINVTMISSSMIKEEEMRMEEMKLRQEREVKMMMIEQEEEMKKKRKQEIEEKMKEREKIEKEEVQVVEKKLQQRSQQQGKQEEKNGKTTTSNKSTVQVVRNSGGISKDDAPLPSTSTSMSRAITPTALAAVKEEKTFDNAEEIPLTHPDDEDTDSPNDVAQQVPQEDNQDDDYQEEEDEPSCTSSAYMSVALFKNNTRSFSTAATDVSSVVSDLTDVHSWLSQTGIEVVPFAGVSDDKNDATTLPLNSRFHDVQVLDEEESIASPINNVDTEDHDASVDTHTGTKKEEVDSCRPTATNMKTKSTSSFPHRNATRSSTWSLPTPKKKNKMTWRQQLTCGGLVPLCGGGHVEEEEVFNVNDDDNIIIHDALSEAVDEDDVISTNKYSLANLGQCEAIQYQPSSYYTEDDTSFVEYVDDDDDEVSEQSDDESYVSETSSKDEFTMNEKYIEGIIFD